MPRLAYLALGTNLGDRAGYLREAIARLSAAPNVNFRRASRVYQTEPVGPQDQPRYLNMVVEVELDVQVHARDLLRLAKQIETELGRQTRERWGPREIDVDVLWVEGEQVKETDLQVPHPRMWERAFVLVPLAELAPALRAPGGETVAELARRLGPEQGVSSYAGTP
jgi:2-amino-4-hydroxy-6-hydroxymethyldihydropteridine diphosphokinase